MKTAYNIYLRKTVLSVVAFLFFGVTVLFAQTDTAMVKTDSVKSKGFGKVYVIRATGYSGSLSRIKIMVDDQAYCKIKNNAWAVFDVPAGDHVFYIPAWDAPNAKEKRGLTIPIEAGKTYYLRMVIKERYFQIVTYFEEITYNSAKPMLEHYKHDDKCD